MSLQHAELGDGKWDTFTLVEQLAHIGSEVNRALNWKQKNRPEIARGAFERSLELFDFTLNSRVHQNRMTEVARARECWVDYFAGTNEYVSTEASWKKYFLQFADAASRGR